MQAVRRVVARHPEVDIAVQVAQADDQVHVRELGLHQVEQVPQAVDRVRGRDFVVRRKDAHDAGAHVARCPQLLPGIGVGPAGRWP